MSSAITSTDLRDVADALGVDPVNLVSYGRTMLIKPGTVTSDGVIVTGPYVERVLRSRWQVFPQAVEYGPGFDDALMEAGSDGTELDLMGLEDEVDELDDVEFGADVFGVSARKAARMKKRYMKLYGKLAACRDLVAAGKGSGVLPSARDLLIPVVGPFMHLAKVFSKDKRIKAKARQCDRLLKRLSRVRVRMERKGIDVTGLPDPSQLASQMQAQLTRGRGRQRVSRQSMRRPMRQAGPPRWRQQRMMQMQQQPQPGGYVPTSQAVSRYYHADQAALEAEASKLMPSYMGGEAARWDELAADLRAEAQGFLFGGMEHDYYGLADGDDYGALELFGLDADEDELGYDDTEGFGLDDEDDFEFGSDDDLGLDDDDLDDDDLGLDDDDLDDDDFGAFDPAQRAARIERRQEHLQKLRQVGRKAGRAFMRVNKQIMRSTMPPGVPTPPVPFRKKGNSGWRKKFHHSGRKMNRMRGEIMGSAALGNDGYESMLDVDASLRAMSPNDGVMWSRMRPRSTDSDAPLVVMVGMKKRPDLLATLGAMNRYSPTMAARVLRESADPEDWMGQDELGSSARFPAGDGAPLPPPRRVGQEIYAG